MATETGTPSELATSEMPVSDLGDGEATPQPVRVPTFPPYPPYTTEPAPPSVADTIIAGHDLRLQHKSVPKKPLRPPPKPAKPRGPKATDVKLTKRALRAHARCLRKHGAILTDRLERMAKPLRRNIIYLWREHAYTLPPETISRLRSMLDADEPFKPDQAYEYFVNLKKTKKKVTTTARVNEIKKDILAMCGEKRFIWARNATVAFARGIQQRLSRPGRYTLADGMLRLSNIILDEICGYMHMRTPSRRSTNPKAKFMMELSDKVAVWIDEILSESDDRMLMMDFDEDDDMLIGPDTGGGGDESFADDFLDMMGAGPAVLLNQTQTAFSKFDGNMKEAFNILMDSMEKKGDDKLLSHGKFSQTYLEGAETLRQTSDLGAIEYNTKLAEKIKKKLGAAVKDGTPVQVERAMKDMVDICSKYLAQNAEYNKKKGPAFKALVDAMRSKPNEKLYLKGKIQKTNAQAADELDLAKGLDTDHDDPNLSQEIHSAMTKLVKDVTPDELKKEMTETVDICSKYLSQKAVDESERGPAFELLVKELNKHGSEPFSDYPALNTKHAAAYTLTSAPGLASAPPDHKTISEFKKALHDVVDAVTPRNMKQEMNDVIDRSADYLSGFIRDRGPAMDALMDMMESKPKNVFVKRNDYTMDYETAATETKNAPTLVPYLPVKDIAEEGKQNLTKDMKDVTPSKLKIPMQTLIDDVSKYLSQAVAMRSGVAGDRYPMNFLAAVKNSMGDKPLFKYKDYGQTYADAADTLKHAGPLESAVTLLSRMNLGSQQNITSKQNLAAKEVGESTIELGHEIASEMKRGVPGQLAPTIAEGLQPTMDKAAKHLANIGSGKGKAMEHLVDLMKEKGETPLGQLQGYEQTHSDGARRIDHAPTLTNEKVDKGAYEAVKTKLTELAAEKPMEKHAELIPAMVEETAKFLSAPVPETQAEKRAVLGDLMAREGDKMLADDGIYKMTYNEGGKEIKNAPVGIIKAHDEVKKKEMEKKLEAVIPDKKMAALLKEPTAEGAAHLTDVVKGRGEAMEVIQEGLKKEKDKELIEVGEFKKTHEQAADMLAQAPHLTNAHASPVILEKIEHQIATVPKDVPPDKTMAAKHMDDASKIVSKYIAGVATEESGLGAKELAALDDAGFNADSKAAAEAKRKAAVEGGVGKKVTEGRVQASAKEVQVADDDGEEGGTGANKSGTAKKKGIGSGGESAGEEKADAEEAKKGVADGQKNIAAGAEAVGPEGTETEGRGASAKKKSKSTEKAHSGAEQLAVGQLNTGTGAAQVDAPGKGAEMATTSGAGAVALGAGVTGVQDTGVGVAGGAGGKGELVAGAKEADIGVSSAAAKSPGVASVDVSGAFGVGGASLAGTGYDSGTGSHGLSGVGPGSEGGYGPEGKISAGYGPDRTGPGSTCSAPHGPGSAVFSPDGVVLGPGGAGLGPGGVGVGPDGAIYGPGGAGSTGSGPGGTAYAPGGTALGPRVASYGPGGVGVGPDGAVYGPDGTVLGPGGAGYIPGGVRVSPGGAAYGPGSVGLSPGGAVYGPGGARYGPGTVSYATGVYGPGAVDYSPVFGETEEQRRRRLAEAEAYRKYEDEERRRLGDKEYFKRQAEKKLLLEAGGPDGRKYRGGALGADYDPEHEAALDILHRELRAFGPQVFYEQPQTRLTYIQASDWLAAPYPMRVDKSVRESSDTTRLHKKFERKLNALVSRVTSADLYDCMQDVVIESARRLSEFFVSTNYKVLVREALISEMQKRGNEIFTEVDGAAETSFFAAQRLKKTNTLAVREPCYRVTHQLSKKLEDIIRYRSMPRKLTATMKEHVREAADYLSALVTKPDDQIEAYVALLNEMEAAGDSNLISGDIPKSHKEAAAYLRQLTSFEDQIQRSNSFMQADIKSKLINLMSNVPPSGYSPSVMDTVIAETTGLLVSYIMLQAEKTEALKVLLQEIEQAGEGMLLRHGPIRKSFNEGADLLRGKTADQLNVPSADPVVSRKIQIRLNNLMLDKTLEKYQPLMDDVIEDATMYLAVQLLQPQVIQVCKCMKNVFVQCELWSDEIFRRVERPCCTCSRHVSAQALQDLAPAQRLRISPGQSRVFAPGLEISITNCPSKQTRAPRTGETPEPPKPCPAPVPTPGCQQTATTSYLLYSTMYKKFGYNSLQPSPSASGSSYSPLSPSPSSPVQMSKHSSPFRTLIQDMHTDNVQFVEQQQLQEQEQIQSLEAEKPKAPEESMQSFYTPESHGLLTETTQEFTSSLSNQHSPTAMFTNVQMSDTSGRITQAKSGYSSRTPISTDQMADWHAMMVSLMWNVQAWRDWIQEIIDRALAHQLNPNVSRDQTADNWTTFHRRVSTEALQWRQYSIFSRQLTSRLVLRYRDKEVVSPKRCTVKTKSYLACLEEMLDIIDMFNRWTQWLTLVVKETDSMQDNPASDIPLHEMRWNHLKKKAEDYSKDWAKYNRYLKVSWEQKYSAVIADYLPSWKEPGPVWVVSACGAVPSGAVAAGVYDGEVTWVARTTHRCTVLPAAVYPSKHCCLVYAEGAVHRYTKYQVMCNVEVRWVAWRGGCGGGGCARAVRAAERALVGRVHYRGDHLLGAVLHPHYRCHVVIFGRPFAFNCYELLVLAGDAN